ncbi:hypothetical protein EMPG_12251 [Blastomyces silverae]|uniref:Uncharacterized protein n=1 Tax=Blastomyces silverae TaxID=2060906 RepID=A0A0H1BMH1_9EURO|nr:hypothetical protein EMPG_12251 [Blastomyces silverae]
MRFMAWTCWIRRRCCIGLNCGGSRGRLLFGTRGTRGGRRRGRWRSGGLSRILMRVRN